MAVWARVLAASLAKAWGCTTNALVSPCTSAPPSLTSLLSSWTLARIPRMMSWQHSSLRLRPPEDGRFCSSLPRSPLKPPLLTSHPAVSWSRGPCSRSSHSASGRASPSCMLLADNVVLSFRLDPKQSSWRFLLLEMKEQEWRVSAPTRPNLLKSASGSERRRGHAVTGAGN